MIDVAQKPRHKDLFRAVPAEANDLAEFSRRGSAKVSFPDSGVLKSDWRLPLSLGKEIELSARALQFAAEQGNAEWLDASVAEAIDRLVSRGGIREAPRERVSPSPCSSPTEDFLDRARRLDELDRTDSALDVIYNHVDEMLLAGRFAEIDGRLASVDCDRYSVDLLLALLTISHAAKRHLPQRPNFHTRAEKSIRDRGQWEDGLLLGLE